MFKVQKFHLKQNRRGKHQIINTKKPFQSYYMKNMIGGTLHMDYELMMNGNVKIGQVAPDFKAQTTFGEVNLKDYRGKWLVFFSHPGDFTPVCSITEE